MTDGLLHENNTSQMRYRIFSWTMRWSLKDRCKSGQQSTSFLFWNRMHKRSLLLRLGTKQICKFDIRRNYHLHAHVHVWIGCIAITTVCQNDIWHMPNVISTITDFMHSSILLILAIMYVHLNSHNDCYCTILLIHLQWKLLFVWASVDPDTM